MLIAPFVRNLRYAISEELFASSVTGRGLPKQPLIKRPLHLSQLQRLPDRGSSGTVGMSASSVQPPTASEAGEPPSQGTAQASSSSEGGDKSAKQLKKEAKKAEKMEKFKKKQEAAKAQGDVSRPRREGEVDVMHVLLATLVMLSNPCSLYTLPRTQHTCPSPPPSCRVAVRRRTRKRKSRRQRK